VAEFDFVKPNREANEREAAIRAGKTPEPKTPEPKAPAQPAVAVAVPDDEDDDEKPGGKPDPGRSARRRERGLLERAAKAEARAELLQELVDKGLTPKAAEAQVAKQDEDPEPQRKDFHEGPAGDATYNRALGRWDARNEAKAEIGKFSASTQELDQLRSAILEADQKAQEDIKLIPDWEEVKKANASDPEAPTYNPADHPWLMRAIHTSDVKAFILHHLAKTPEDFKKLLALSPDPNDPKADYSAQARFFSRLEGKVEKMYSTEHTENV